MSQQLKTSINFCLLASLLLLPMGCTLEEKSNAQPAGGGRGEQAEQPPLVDVAIAETATTENAQSYTGTTMPLKKVMMRSRADGQLLSLNADVGDFVGRGQLIAQLEGNLLLNEVNEAEAELAARQFEVKQAESELAEVLAEVAQNKAQLKQAEADAKRLQELADAGAISIQAAEVAQTQKTTAAKVVKSSQEQVTTQQQAIAARQQRVTAQQAILSQTREKLNYTKLLAPQSGVVLSKAVEAGDIIQSGQNLLEIGDLSAIKVEIQISDRDLSQFPVGQNVTVQLDAFPNETFNGEVTRISPIADAAARLIPIEVTIPNSDNKIATGLLARIRQKSSANQQTVMIPMSALKVGNTSGTAVFVPVKNGDETTVQVRPVQIGKEDNGMVEILSGLTAGEKYIAKGDRPLETGQTVRLSLLSN